MDNYANLCIIMHSTDTVFFRSICLIVKKTCVKFDYDMKIISGEKWKERQITEGFEDTKIKLFTIFIWVLPWSISMPPCLMIVLCTLGYMLSYKFLNKSFVTMRYFTKKLVHFLFKLQNHSVPGSWKSQEISKFLCFDSCPLLMKWITKR